MLFKGFKVWPALFQRLLVSETGGAIYKSSAHCSKLLRIIEFLLSVLVNIVVACGRIHPVRTGSVEPVSKFFMVWRTGKK